MESEKLNMQEKEKQELEDEEEDDEGPPPGFQCIITPQVEKIEAAVYEIEIEDKKDEDEDEGPPPGFAQKPSTLLPFSDIEKSSIQQDTEDDDEDDDGPPPGWEFSSLAHALPKPESNSADKEAEKNEDVNEVEDEDEDEGPPPGWETVLPHQMQPPCAPPLQSASAISADLEMGSKQDVARNDDVEPHSVSESTLIQGRSSPPTPPPPQPLPSSDLSDETKSKLDPKTMEKGPTVEKQSASPQQLLPPTPHPSTPPAASSSSEKAQLVCGTCQSLLLYPRGSKWVQCPSCKEVNFVLEANEVGQVKCGGCSVLLMYPFGAPAVQCTSCRFVTEIGANNRRPPLSVQQAQRRGNRRRNRAR